MSKKQLDLAARSTSAQFDGEGLASAPTRTAERMIDLQTAARAPSSPLFLTHAALLI